MKGEMKWCMSERKMRDECDDVEKKMGGENKGWDVAGSNALHPEKHRLLIHHLLDFRVLLIEVHPDVLILH